MTELLRRRIAALTLTAVLAAVVSTSPALANDIVTRGENLSADVSAVHGRIAFDLAGDIWTLPANGGQASLLVADDNDLSRPRWSPDGDRILYIATSSVGSSMRVTLTGTGDTDRLGAAGMHNQDASWHPDGDRIVYASDRHETGLDLWEMDLATGLEWRLTHSVDDEYEPAWSQNGRHLVWIARSDIGYTLNLRRRNEPPVILVESEVPISAPSWRPDGSLLTYLRHGEDGTSLQMMILSDPVLIRTIDDSASLGPAPVSWRDRMRMVYTAGGMVQTRGFEDRRSRPLHFRALLEPVPEPPPRVITRRQVDIVDASNERLIIRAARLFDGIWRGYRPDMDVITEGGRIVEVERRRERDDGTVLDLGDITIMPGLIDAWSAPVPELSLGPAILSYGVTTIAVPGDVTPFDAELWERSDPPGPRLITWVDDISDDVSSVADASTPGVLRLVETRQARMLDHMIRPGRRFPSLPALTSEPVDLVAASQPNRMPPGFGLHAELRAHVRAGLTPEQALHAAGRNPARILGMENQAGTIIPGALADLVLVTGDPLADIDATLNVVAVVRNGRFFSLVSLLERAGNNANVE